MWRSVGARCIAAAAATVILLTGTDHAASAQVIFGPGNQPGSPGQVVDFIFSAYGPDAPRVAIARFRLLYDPGVSVFDPVLVDATTGQVDCTVAPDLVGNFSVGPVYSRPQDHAVVVSMGDFSFPIRTLGRGGELIRCHFRIRNDAPLGDYLLTCGGTPDATDPNGVLLDTSCGPGILTVQQSITVTLGPGQQFGHPGEETEFAFSVSGPSAADVAVAQFRLAYDPSTSVFDPVLTDPETGTVDCTVASDLADHITPGPVIYEPDNKVIVINFGDFTPPITSLGRDGEVLRCRFRVRSDAPIGAYPLSCAGTTQATGADQVALGVYCRDGSLNVLPLPTATPTKTSTATVTVTPTETLTATPMLTPTRPPCAGDKDGDGEISAEETVLAVRAFSEDNVSFNPAADQDGDGTVDAPELVHVVLNFSQDLCVF